MSVNSYIQGTKNIIAYGTQTVGTTAAQMTAQPCKSVVLKALSTNSDSVYVGMDSSVTNSNGLELDSGDGLAIAVGNLDQIYIYGGAASQVLRWIALT